MDKYNRDSSRTWGLDLIRCIAVLDVVKIHMWQMLFQRYGMDIPFTWPIKGVQLFFVLSGFLIGGIIIRQTETRGWQPANMFRFMVRRWFRTLPNYYAVLLLDILVQYCIGTNGLHDFTFHLFFFTYNLFGPGPNFFMEAWSISVEEWFYLLYALAAGVLYRFMRRDHHIKPISLLIALVMVAVPTLLRCRHAYLDSDLLEKTVIYRIDGIGYGVVAAWFYYYYPLIWQRLRWPLLVCGILLMVVVPLPEGHVRRVLILSLLSLSYIFCLPVFNSLRYMPPVIGPVVQFISKTSYSIYLLNLSVVGGITVWFFPPEVKDQPVAMVATYLILLTGLSLFFYRIIEKPFLEIRDKYFT